MHLLRTHRLELQPAGPEHHEIVHPLWTNREIRRHLFDDRVLEADEVAEFLRSSRANFRTAGFGIWLLFENSTSQTIGFAGLLEGEDGPPSLVYGLLPSHWKQGLALEAARAVVNHARDLGLVRLVADVDEPNEASIRVLERLGMSRTGRRVAEGRAILDFEIQFEDPGRQR